MSIDVKQLRAAVKNATPDQVHLLCAAGHIDMRTIRNFKMGREVRVSSIARLFDAAVDLKLLQQRETTTDEPDPQKPLRIKVRRAFRELTGMEFIETFEEDIKYFYERLCRAKRPWDVDLIRDAEALMYTASSHVGGCSLFNKGGQAYVALKAIKKCLS